MAQNEYNTTSRPKGPRIRAQDVHRLTEEVLQAHWQLDMEKSLYTAEDIWDVVIAAAVERMTIEMACDLLRMDPTCSRCRDRV